MRRHRLVIVHVDLYFGQRAPKRRPDQYEKPAPGIQPWANRVTVTAGNIGTHTREGVYRAEFAARGSAPSACNRPAAKMRRHALVRVHEHLRLRQRARGIARPVAEGVPVPRGKPPRGSTVSSKWQTCTPGAGSKSNRRPRPTASAAPAGRTTGHSGIRPS